ncbi:MAG: Eco57I restriction-modification methylase domain-containing protein, partial [Bacillota bacterium]
MGKGSRAAATLDEILDRYADDPVAVVRAVARGDLPEAVAAVAAGAGREDGGEPVRGWAAAALVYESLLGARRRRTRKVAGAYYTSRQLVDRLVDLTLAPLLEPSRALKGLRLLDPCVGGGAFLVAAAPRLGEAFAAAGLRRQAVAACLCGVDSDPLAVEIAAGAVAEALGLQPDDVAERFAIADSLLEPDLRPLFRGVGPDGFDAVVGNPPWEIIKPNSREFFAQYDPGFRARPKTRALARASELMADPEVARAWAAEQSRVAALAAHVRGRGPFRHQGASGDFNTYKLFLERAIELCRPGGRVGLILPSGFHTDLGARDLRRLAFEENTVQ